MPIQRFDYIAVGSGLAGLTFALRAARHGTVCVLTKSQVFETNTNYAQGGIAAAVGEADSWELHERGVPVTLICDSMAAQVMREGRVSAVITGADRIAANGDTANKIGTYGLALLAKTHNIPFYIAAPTSTFDLTIPNGDAIPIERRAAAEITHGFGRQTAPAGIDVYNPAFDVTPADLIHTIICEKGPIHPVNKERILEVFLRESDKKL